MNQTQISSYSIVITTYGELVDQIMILDEDPGSSPAISLSLFITQPLDAVGKMGGPCQVMGGSYGLHSSLWRPLHGKES